MKPILKWLETKFSRQGAAGESDQGHTPAGVRVRPSKNAKAEYTNESSGGGEMPGSALSHGPGREVSMREAYTCDDTVAQRQLNALNESPPDACESDGFDPYNTGRLDSKAWNSRSTK